MEFVKNQKGGNYLLHEGFTYRKRYQRGDKTFWSCSKYDTEHCRAACKTENGAIISTIGEHNHTVDPAETDVRNRLALLKFRALTTQELPCHIIAQIVTNASQSVAVALPSSALLTRIINKTRKKVQLVPANATSLDGLQIPASYTVTTSGDTFLLANIGEADRILIFSTTSNLQSLANAELRHADGTFKCVPSFFQQLYTIHCVKDNTTFPCVFALLPFQINANKPTIACWQRSRVSLKIVNLIWIPRRSCRIMRSGSSMRVKPSFRMRNTKDVISILVSACGEKYKSIQIFQDGTKMMTTLPWIFVNFLLWLSCQFNMWLHLLSFSWRLPSSCRTRIPFVDYVEDTWIGRPQRGERRRLPIFAHEIWNTFDSTTNGK